jgi:hypothetical protein
MLRSSLCCIFVGEKQIPQFRIKFWDALIEELGKEAPHVVTRVVTEKAVFYDLSQLVMLPQKTMASICTNIINELHCVLTDPLLKIANWYSVERKGAPLHIRLSGLTHPVDRYTKSPMYLRFVLHKYHTVQFWANFTETVSLDVSELQTIQTALSHRLEDLRVISSAKGHLFSDQLQQQDLLKAIHAVSRAQQSLVNAHSLALQAIRDPCL